MLTINASIAILVGLADHLVNLVISQLLANRGHDMTELGGGDEAVVVTVENLGWCQLFALKSSRCGPITPYLEGLPDLLLGISVLHFASHHGKELCAHVSQTFRLTWELALRVAWAPTRKVDGAVVVGVDLIDHVLQLRLRGVLSKGAHDGAQLLSGDLSCRPSIELVLQYYKPVEIVPVCLSIAPEKCFVSYATSYVSC